MIKPLQALVDDAQLRKNEFVFSAFQRWSSTLKSTVFGAESNKIAVSIGDSTELCGVLLALWRLRQTPVLVSSTSPEALISLKELCDYSIGNLFDDNTVKKLTLKENNYSGLNKKNLEDIGVFKPIDDAELALVLFTSGSEGEPQAIDKTFRQLNQELSTLESMWGERVGDALITGTVSHQHIYGLLFRVLWPLVTGRNFTATTRSYWEEILADVANPNGVSGLVVISSPAHLHRMPELTADDWYSLKSKCKLVFSSGAPLSLAGAEDCRKLMNVCPIEVLGSTETGGIAWRKQLDSPNWTCFEDVTYQVQDGRLLLSGPKIGIEDWYLSSDRVESIDGKRFNHLGRIDNLVKIAGKRISLTAVEIALKSNDRIKQCRVIVMPEKNDRLAAVVILKKEQQKILVDIGKRRYAKQLQGELEANLDPLAIPRYWRFRSRLPTNEQGKTTKVLLGSLFLTDLPELPEVHSQLLSGHSITMSIIIPINLKVFDGHFIGNPVLPGVTQIDWAINYGCQLLSISKQLKIKCLEVIKFQHIISAGDKLELLLDWDEKKLKLKYKYLKQGKQMSSGRIAFTPDQPE